VLSLRRLTKEYERGKPVLTDISLDFPARGVVAIIGPSGTGKSTLIRCINRWWSRPRARCCSAGRT
jgi:phosphonate transport system ATP-binding protein